MKTYTTTDGEKIRKNGRYKKIYFNNAGEPYFIWNGRQQKLDEVMRLTYPIYYEDDNGKTGVIGGYITICNTYGVYIEIDPNGEAAQVWEAVNE